MANVYFCTEVTQNICTQWANESSVLMLEDGQGIAVGMQLLALCGFAFGVKLILSMFLKG